jgi:hypothetical protein
MDAGASLGLLPDERIEAAQCHRVARFPRRFSRGRFQYGDLHFKLAHTAGRRFGSLGSHSYPHRSQRTAITVFL